MGTFQFTKDTYTPSREFSHNVSHSEYWCDEPKNPIWIYTFSCSLELDRSLSCLLWGLFWLLVSSNLDAIRIFEEKGSLLYAFFYFFLYKAVITERFWRRGNQQVNSKNKLSPSVDPLHKSCESLTQKLSTSFVRCT